MHIAQVLLSPRIGGAESLAADLAKYWATKDITSEILYLEPDGVARSKLWRAFALRKALIKSQADVVLSHSALPNIYTCLVAPRGIPVVNVLHSASDDFASIKLRLAERLLQQRRFAVVAVSKVQAERYEFYFGTRVLTVVIPNGVRDDLPFKETFPTRPQRVITMSRVASQKNPALWIATAKSLAESEADLELIWFGPVTAGSDLETLTSAHAASGEPGKFAGPTSDPQSKLLDSDIFFHPSSSEAHSIGILEAAAVGLPIVCSFDVSLTTPEGVASVTFDGPNGWTAAEAIRYVAGNWARSTSDRRTISILVRDAFGMKTCAEAYLAVFEKAVVRKSSSLLTPAENRANNAN
jgi:glycosyltransferase involved in cell wall biosynthesis